MKRTLTALLAGGLIAATVGGISLLAESAENAAPAVLTAAPAAEVPGAAGIPPSGSAAAAEANPAAPTVTVYKTPTCGCCAKWIDHLEAHGFSVDAKDTEEMDQVKATLGVPRQLESCHTGIAGGYVIEGHVPAEDVKRLLAERPKVAGIAVPGMPLGSPGMEAPRSQRYDVLTFTREGRTEVFARH